MLFVQPLQLLAATSFFPSTVDEKTLFQQQPKQRCHMIFELFGSSTRYVI
jgi:hypothetical protein